MLNVGLVLGTVIALPIAKARATQVQTPTSWVFVLAWLSPIWTIGAFDSCVHMGEEATHAAKAVPHGILGSIAGAWSLGFLCISEYNPYTQLLAVYLLTFLLTDDS